MSSANFMNPSTTFIPKPDTAILINATSLAPNFDLNNTRLLAPNSTTDFLNTTTEDAGSIFPLTVSVIVMAVTSPVAAATVVGNLMVLLAFYLERPLRENYSNYLIVSMAACDLMMGALCPIPANLDLVLSKWIFGWLYCQVWDNSAITLAIISQTNALCISIDRFLAIRYPTKYRAWRTKKKMLMVVCLIWTIPSGLILYIYFIWTEDMSPDFTIDRPRCFLRMPNLVRFVIYFMVFCIRILIMGCIYLYLYNVASKLHQRFLNQKKDRKLVEHISRTISEVTSHDKGNFSNQNVSNCLAADGCSVSDGLIWHANKRAILYSRIAHSNNAYDANNAKVSMRCQLKERNQNNIISNKTFVEYNKYISHMNLRDLAGREVTTQTIDINTNRVSHRDIPPKTDTNNNSKAPSYKTESLALSDSMTSMPSAALVEKSVVDGTNKSLTGGSVNQKTYLNAPLLPFGTSTSVDKESAHLRTRTHATPSSSPNKFRSNLDNTDNRELTQRRMRKAVRTVTFILTANICCYGPYAFVAFITFLSDRPLPIYLTSIVVFLMAVNSMINPFMYALVNPLFKATFHRICRCHCQRNRNRWKTVL